MTYLDKLVDYTMNTPHNTNAAIVKSLAERYAEEKAGGGVGSADILETITVSEPNVTFEGIIPADSWGAMGWVADYTFTTGTAPFAVGDTCEVVFNGTSYRETITDDNGSLEFHHTREDNKWISVTYDPSYGDLMLVHNFFNKGNEFTVDSTILIINGTIEKTETKIKPEYLPDKPMFVHFVCEERKGDMYPQHYDINVTYAELEEALNSHRPISGAVTEIARGNGGCFPLMQIGWGNNGIAMFYTTNGTDYYGGELRADGTWFIPG